jgi:SAM-dependent methyltransferase
MGTTTVQGQLWGARADDWATVQEATARPCYHHALDTLAPLHGLAVIDLGCGAGGFAALADQRGAAVTGVDGAAPLLAIAERRVPQATFRVADLEDLPYADASFDIATGFNSFQYAADPLHALAEAGRVVRSGGRVLAMTWGSAQECEAAAYLAALGALLPPPPPGTPGPFALSEPGAIEDLMTKAALRPAGRHAVACPWTYPDPDTALRGLLSAGPAVRAIQHRGIDAVTSALVQAVEPFRQPDGSYLMHNTFHYMIATTR